MASEWVVPRLGSTNGATEFAALVRFVENGKKKKTRSNMSCESICVCAWNHIVAAMHDIWPSHMSRSFKGDEKLL